MDFLRRNRLAVITLGAIVSCAALVAGWIGVLEPLLWNETLIIGSQPQTLRGLIRECADSPQIAQGDPYSNLVHWTAMERIDARAELDEIMASPLKPYLGDWSHRTTVRRRLGWISISCSNRVIRLFSSGDVYVSTPSGAWESYLDECDLYYRLERILNKAR